MTFMNYEAFYVSLVLHKSFSVKKTLADEDLIEQNV